MECTLEKRFWSKVDKKGDDECWEWLGGRERSGYGRISDSVSGKMIKAHRYSYELAYGQIPEGLFVCHKCDNPPCVNPNHFFLGSHQDNVDDCVRKGRKPRGKDWHPTPKLTSDQVIEIKKMLVNGMRVGVIAKHFSVSHNTISNIKTGISWRYITLDD